MKKKLKLAAVLALIGVLAVLGCNLWVVYSGKGKVFDQLAEVPGRPVGLVLGASRTLGDGRYLNPHFQNRIAAAAELYHAGKVQHLLLSGDNSRADYDEPTDMQQALLIRGVPVSAMTRDYAGFRTLDSVVRAKEVFGVTQLIVVSGAFHNYRALFMARHFGLDAVAYNARPVPMRFSLRTHVREWLARVKAVLDLYVLRTQPRFYGPQVPLVGGPEPTVGPKPVLQV
jgi:SanA protein